MLRDSGAAPADRPPDRESRLLRDRGAARARAARRRGRPGERRRRREVGRLGRRARAQAELSRERRAREPLRLQGRAATSTSPSSRRRSASPSASSPTSCRCGADCSRPATCAGSTSATCTRAARGRVRRLARRHRPARGRRRPSSRASRARTLPSSRVFGDRATDRVIVICAIDNLGKGAAGQAVQNANLVLGYPGNGGSAAVRGARMSVTAARGFVAERSPCGDPPLGARDLARRCARRAPAVGGAMFSRNRVQAARLLVEPRAPRAGRAAGRRRQLGRRERGDGRAREARCARDRCRGGAAARSEVRAGARPLDRRDRRAASAGQAARRPRACGRRRCRRTGAQTPPRRS